ncbi:MAG: hypothetical protein PHP04_09195 [Bacteroidales bacterium]|nr:hypothetical protein [Bacteroidales bacterium]HNW74081.1 hypothetical protein [Bacteroidales bacterium]HPS51104.1 hypothetical protein [Bacteroidales bacterium]
MEPSLSEKESLELISKMISSAKNNLQKGTGRIFLLWGYLIVAVSIVNLILLIMIPGEDRYLSYCIWCIMPMGLIYHYRLVKKINLEGGVKTYTEQVLDYVWIAFSISVFTIIISMIMASIPALHETESLFSVLEWIHWTFLIPVMLILYGFALFISGRAYRFIPMVTGSFVCWGMSFLIFLLIRSDYILEIQLIALIVSVLAGYIFPGHLLRLKETSHV